MNSGKTPGGRCKKRSRLVSQDIKFMVKTAGGGGGGPKQAQIQIKITRPPHAGDNVSCRPKLSESGEVRILAENQNQTCRATCPHDATRFVEVIVGAGTFEAPTQAEANDMAIEFGNQMAQAMLDCSAVVMFNLTDPTNQVTAFVSVSDPFGNTFGPEQLDAANPAAFTLQTGVNYSWFASFYSAGGSPQPQSGSFPASEGHSVTIIV